MQSTLEHIAAAVQPDLKLADLPKGDRHVDALLLQLNTLCDSPSFRPDEAPELRAGLRQLAVVAAHPDENVRRAFSQLVISENVMDNNKGAEALAQVADQAVFRLLQIISKEGGVQGRTGVVMALPSVTKRCPENIEAGIALAVSNFDPDEPRLCWKAIRSIGEMIPAARKMGAGDALKDAAQAMLPLLAAANGDVRVTAISTLIELRDLNPDIVPAIRAKLQDPESRVVEQAVAAVKIVDSNVEKSELPRHTEEAPPAKRGFFSFSWLGFQSDAAKKGSVV